MTNILAPGLASEVLLGNVSVQVANTNMGVNGGYIINPESSLDQGIHIAEGLYINLFGPASTTPGSGNIRLVPGQTYVVPPQTNVWVNAKTSGHKFTAVFSSPYSVSYPPQQVPGQPGTNLPGFDGARPFPPPGVTGLTTVIPSYLYQEYSDDDDLQGFCQSQNEMQQNYVDTFNALNLPIYPGPIVSGALLDWVGRGVYGMARPAISSGKKQLMGPLNTYGSNWLVPMWDFGLLPIPAAYNYQAQWHVATNSPNLAPAVAYPEDGWWWRAVTVNPSIPETALGTLPGIGGKLIYDGDLIYWNGTNRQYVQQESSALRASFGLNMVGLYGPEDVVLANDDVYRRILTWHFYKGDGNYFSTRWLKRRVWRFLFGKDGWGPEWVDWWPNDNWIADTEQISVTLGSNKNVTIRFILGNRKVTGGALLNVVGCNGFEPKKPDTSAGYPVTAANRAWDIGTDKTSSSGALIHTVQADAFQGDAFQTGQVAPGRGIYLNDLETTYTPLPGLPMMTIFKEAVDAGILELPYQWNWTVHIG